MESSRYDAFISYSHQKDRRLARNLQRLLPRIGKPWYRLRRMRIFRDETDLAASPDLWGEVQRALDESDHLILLASVQAASSKWVLREVEHWQAAGKVATLYIALTDGEIAWDENKGDFDWQRTTALPRALEGIFACEPLWVDLRGPEAQDSARRGSEFYASVARLAAKIHGFELDMLLSQDYREHRRTLTVAWGGAVVMAVLAALAIFFMGLAQDRAEEALRERNRAVVNAYGSQLERAAAVGRTDPSAALDSLADPKLFPPDVRDLGWRILGARFDRKLLEVESAHALDLAFRSGSGRLPALVTVTAAGHVESWDVESGERSSVLDLGHPITGLPSEQRWIRLRWDRMANPIGARFSPDGQYLAVLEEDRLALWSIRRGEIASLLQAPIARYAFAPDSRSIATISEAGVIRVWDVPSGAEQVGLRFDRWTSSIYPQGFPRSRESVSITGMALVPSRSSFTVYFGISEVFEGEFHMARLLRVDLPASQGALTAAESDDSTAAEVLGTGPDAIDELTHLGTTGQVVEFSTMLDFATFSPPQIVVRDPGGAVRRRFVDPESYVSAVAAPADGSTVAVGSDRGVVRLLDSQGRSILLSLRHRDTPVRRIAVGDAASLVASSHADGSLIVWRTGSEAIPMSEETAGAIVTSLDFVRPTRVRIGYERGSEISDAVHWDLGSGSTVPERDIEEDLDRLPGGQTLRLPVDFSALSPADPEHEWQARVASPDGSSVVLATRERWGLEAGALAIWDVKNGRGELVCSEETALPLRAAEYSGDGRIAVIADNAARIWVFDGTWPFGARIELEAPGLVSQLRLSEDGRFVAVIVAILEEEEDAGIPAQGEAWLRDLRDDAWTRVATETCDTGMCLDFNRSADSPVLAVGTVTGSIVLTDPTGTQSELLVQDHAGAVTSVEFSPGGSTLISSASEPGGVPETLLRHPSTGETLYRLRFDGLPVSRLAFSFDGATMAAATQDGRIWAIRFR